MPDEETTTEEETETTEEEETEEVTPESLAAQQATLTKGFQTVSKREKEAEQLFAQAQQLLNQAQAQQVAPLTPKQTNKLLEGMEPEYRDAFMAAVDERATAIVEAKVGPLLSRVEAEEATARDATLKGFFSENPDLDEDDVLTAVFELYPLDEKAPSAKQLTGALAMLKKGLAPDNTDQRVADKLAEITKTGGKTARVIAKGEKASSGDSLEDKTHDQLLADVGM